MKPADLLNAWRDAVRAAELAERLATVAAEASFAADERAIDTAELANLAEQAAASATRAAERARATATAAATFANQLRDEQVPDARRTVDSTQTAENEARTAFHESEEQVRVDTPTPN